MVKITKIGLRNNIMVDFGGWFGGCWAVSYLVDPTSRSNTKSTMVYYCAPGGNFYFPLRDVLWRGSVSYYFRSYTTPNNCLCSWSSLFTRKSVMRMRRYASTDRMKRGDGVLYWDTSKGGGLRKGLGLRLWSRKVCDACMKNVENGRMHLFSWLFWSYFI